MSTTGMYGHNIYQMMPENIASGIPVVVGLEEKKEKKPGFLKKVFSNRRESKACFGDI